MHGNYPWSKFFLCLLLLAGIGFFTALPSEASCFPSVQLKPLEKGPALALPKGHQKPLFIAVGFDHRLQPSLEASLLGVEALQKEGLGLHLLEIPVIDPQYKSFESQITPFMRGNVKNKQFLKVVYPYYVSKQQLRQQLGLTSTHNAAYLLCSQSGQLLWKSTKPKLDASDVSMVRKALRS